MRLGFHISIAGGLSRVIPRALKTGCDTIQIFSGNPRGWKRRSLEGEEVETFHADLSQTEITPVFVHASYLINLASPDAVLYSRSIASLGDELSRAYRLGAQFVIVHVGNRLNTEESLAMNRIAAAVNHVFRKADNSVRLLLENTAGQGTEVGFTFRQLAGIVELIDEKERLGFCLDTAHAFAAGYDLSAFVGLDRLIREIEVSVGLDSLKALHLNDSRAGLGSRVDRHWHIGEGGIGMPGFLNILSHPVLAALPGIMETPRERDADDLKNMKVMRSLIRQCGSDCPLLK
ncbi:MAG: deoxyribonuclease IV [Deltaproteobacteria bacterium]|nr:deoxyribonuclease IV [Deltaproteobacteria bacterium]